MDRARLTPCYKTKVSSIRLHLHRGFVIVDNYNKQIIIWITTFNAASSITRSCYLRLTLCGCREKPLSVTLDPCNPESVKPNDYKCGNIINTDYNFATKKETPKMCLVRHFRGLDKQNVS